MRITTYSLNEPIKIWTSKTSGKGASKYSWYYIEKSDLKKIDDILFSTRRVMLDKKGHAIAQGKGNVINNIPQIYNKDAVGNSVLRIFPEKVSNTDRQLLLLRSLFMTKTARYLMSITQKSLYVRGFENIPDYKELAKLLPEDELFADECFIRRLILVKNSLKI